MLALLTLTILIAPGLPLLLVASEADHLLNTSATLVAGAVAALAWIRYREAQLHDALYQAAAFAVLFTGGAISVLLLLSNNDVAAGFTAEAPGQAPLYIWTIQRLFAGGLLLLGAYVALVDRPAPSRRRAALITVVPATLVLVTGGAIIAFDDYLPPLVPPSFLAVLTTRLEDFAPSLINPPMFGLQFAVGMLFIGASVGYAWVFARRPASRPYSAYLAVALLVAAFSQLHFAIVPGAYNELLSSGDVLRVVFYVIVGVGVGAAARQDLRDLLHANRRLQELRESDERRITLEERARLARDVHDGLVQDLWLTRLTHGRLVQETGLPAAAREVAERVDSMLEDALAEARQAIVAMQPSPDPSFGNLLTRFVEDYGDRFGLEVECDVDGRPVQLTGRAQAEVLRICREALNNARKHADATLVRVSFRADERALALSVADNGCGFEEARQNSRGYGLSSMRDRAEALGAQLRIESEPRAGTRVTLELPLAEERDEQASRMNSER